MIDWQNLIQIVINSVPKLIGAVAIIFFGWIIIKFLLKGFDKTLTKKKVDPTAKIFLENILRITLKLLVLISAASFLGLEMASFIAVLAAMAFAVGLALQGSLSNFAGGVLIILFKLYKKGDFIEAQGQMGTVEKIEIFHTTLKTPQNQVIIVPNGALANGTIKNYSAMPTRRADWIFGIGYDDDFEKARKIILNILKKDERVLKDPEPFIKVTELSASSVNITVRAWSKKEDFWDLMFDVTEKVKKSFDKENISIPYPQMDLHMKKS